MDVARGGGGGGGGARGGGEGGGGGGGQVEKRNRGSCPRILDACPTLRIKKKKKKTGKSLKRKKLEMSAAGKNGAVSQNRRGQKQNKVNGSGGVGKGSRLVEGAYPGNRTQCVNKVNRGGGPFRGGKNRRKFCVQLAARH